MPRIFRVKRYHPRAVALVAAMLAAAAAHAGTYEISYTGATDPATVSGDVFVTTTDVFAGGSFTVLSINGERNGIPVTMLSAYASSDQLLYAISPLVDFSGISFSTAAAAGDFNLYSSGSGYYETSSAVDPGGYGLGATPINLTVAAVSEPTSIALFGVGLMGLCALFYGRRRVSPPR